MTGVLTWRLLLEYDGTDFIGWQRQPEGRSVQDVVGAALCRVLGGESPRLVASGRTDSGVHALGQVASFTSSARRTPRQLRMGLNSALPNDVSCVDAALVEPGFDALAMAREKHYRYRIQDTGERSPTRDRYLWHLRGPLDHEAMDRSARSMEGALDFTSFRATGCAARTSTRVVTSCRVSRAGDELWVDVRGRGFLRHMVRIMVGTMVDVGFRRQDPEWVAEVLAALDRSRAGRTAPARGLCLVSVDYGDMACPSPGDP